MAEYLTTQERLRRMGELLLKGIYLWAEAEHAVEASGAAGIEWPLDDATVGVGGGRRRAMAVSLLDRAGVVQTTRSVDWSDHG